MKELVNYIHDLVYQGLEKMGLYYSVYRGFVYDNDDPKGYGRLKLSVPEVYGDMVLNTWAWPVGNFAGKNYGVQCLPQRNDLVWVKFEKGNPRKPVWQYGYFGKGEKPADLTNPNLIWFITPKQNKIIIDDEAGKITFISNTGRLIELTDKIALGKEGPASHPVALGDTTQDKLEALIDILLNMKVMTALGPQPMMPIFLVQLEQLKQTLSQIKSTITTTE